MYLVACTCDKQISGYYLECKSFPPFSSTCFIFLLFFDFCWIEFALSSWEQTSDIMSIDRENGIRALGIIGLMCIKSHRSSVLGITPQTYLLTVDSLRRLLWFSFLQMVRTQASVSNDGGEEFYELIVNIISRGRGRARSKIHACGSASRAEPASGRPTHVSFEPQVEIAEDQIPPPPQSLELFCFRILFLGCLACQRNFFKVVGKFLPLLILRLVKDF